MAGQHFTFLVCGPSGTPIGEALNAKVRQLTMLLNGVHSATIALPLLNGGITNGLAAGLTPGTGRLKVYRSPSQAQLAANPGTQPQLLFYGQLPATNVMLDTGSSEDTDGLVTAIYQDPRWRFVNLVTSGTEGNFVAADQGLILATMLTAQNARTGLAPPLDTYILPGSFTTGKLRDRNFTMPDGPGQIVFQSLFDEFVALDGGVDYDITPIDGSALAVPTMQMATLNVYYPKQGTNRPNATFTLGADLKSNVQQITLSYAPLVTQSTHTGQDTTGLLISATQGAPSSAAGQFGVLDLLQNDQSVSDPATLLAKAVNDIAVMSQLRPIITVSNPLPDAPAAWEDYNLGDTVYVSCRKGSLVLNAVPLRVHGIDLNVTEDGFEAVTLTLAMQ